MPSDKASKREAAKKAAQQPQVGDSKAKKEAPSGGFVVQVKALMQGSMLYQGAVKMPAIFEDGQQIAKVKKEKKDDDGLDDVPDFAVTADDETSEAMKEMLRLANAVDSLPTPKQALKKAAPSSGEAGRLFATMASRLSLTNPLGLFESSDDGIKAAKVIMELEYDGGKGTQRKGPLDRISTNVRSHFLVYLHAAWTLMSARALLFRSFFACLPWLFGWQVASVFLPLTQTKEVPLPLEKVPVEARAVLTFGFHSLLWLFFVYEFLVQLHWLEWFLLAAIISGHAYLFRPLNT